METRKNHNAIVLVEFQKQRTEKGLFNRTQDARTVCVGRSGASR